MNLGPSAPLYRKVSPVMKTESVFTEAVNLRRDDKSPGIWRRAGMPAKVSPTDALLFLRFSPFGDGRELVLLTGPANELYFREEVDGAPAPGSRGVLKLLGSLPAAPILADCSAPGVIRLMVSHRPDRYLTYDSALNLTLAGAMPEIPQVAFQASEFNTLYETVPPVQLSGTSVPASGGSLAAADEAKLTSNLVGSYDSLRARCRSMNYSLQPRLVRSRLLDAAGNTLRLGPAVLVGVPEGFSATGSVVQNSVDSLVFLSAGRIEATVFRPCLKVPEALPAPWNRLVNRLVVEMSPEIEPLDRAASAGYGMTHNASSSVTVLTSRLPGFSRGTVLDKARFTRLVAEAEARGMVKVAEYALPFGGGLGSPGELKPLPVPAEGAVLSPPDPLSLASLQPGSTYSAALEDAGITVLCNPLCEPTAGWSPLNFIAGRESQPPASPWKLAFSVKVATPAGSSYVMSQAEGTDNAPASLGPVLSFPSLDAVELTVSYLHPSGALYGQVFPLTPDPATGTSRYIHEAAARITLPAIPGGEYAPRSDPQTSRLLDGTAEILPTSDLRAPSARMKIMDGPIHAVRAAPRSGSGWDFSRRKLLFFGSCGISLATVNAAGQFHALVPVDNRPVPGPRAVCSLTTPRGASIAAIAGNDILEIGGQKATTLLRSLPARALGWSEPFKELWIITSDNSLLRLTHSGEVISALLPSVQTEGARLASDRGKLLLSCPTGVYELSAEEPVPKLPVLLRERLEPSGHPRRLILSLFASNLEGSFTLSGDRGTEIPEKLLTLRFPGGPLNEQLPLRLASPRRRWLQALLSASASRDLALHPLSLSP